MLETRRRVAESPGFKRIGREAADENCDPAAASVPAEFSPPRPCGIRTGSSTPYTGIRLSRIRTRSSCNHKRRSNLLSPLDSLLCSLYLTLFCLPFNSADARTSKTLQCSPTKCYAGWVSLSAEAIAQLVAGHREFLAFLERRVESREAAEDILQSAFARGLERGEGVDGEKVVAWFYRVLRNAVIDHYRHRSSSARAMEAWGREIADSQTPDVELRQEICQCVSSLLATLKPEYRDALRIVDLEDGKLSDLADQAGINAENAAVRVHRARKALRQQVQKACGTCADHGCFDCRCKP